MKPGDFTGAAQPYVGSFAFKDIAPPSNLYVRPDDLLAIETVATDGAAVNVNVVARLLMISPEISGQPSEPPPTPIAQVGPASSQTIKLLLATIQAGSISNTKTTFQMAEGYLLMVGVQAQAAQIRGAVFCRGTLVRQIGGGLIVRIPLFSDYLTGTVPTGWPFGRSVSSVEGPGFLQSQQVTTPAAGADWSITVPGAERWHFVSLSATFTAAVAVANRQVEIIVDDGVNVYWVDDASASITASTVNTITATTTNVPTGVVTTIQNVTLPPGLTIPGNHRIRSNTLNIAAADTWTNIFMLLEKWVEVA